MERPSIRLWSQRPDFKATVVAPIDIMVYGNIVFGDYRPSSRPIQYVDTARDVKLLSRLSSASFKLQNST